MENQDEEFSDEVLARIFDIVGGRDEYPEEENERDVVDCDGCEEPYFLDTTYVCNFCPGRFCENCIDEHEMGEHERPATPARELL